MKIKGIYLLYRVLLAFGLPFLLLYFLWRGLRHRGYWNSLPERFGFLPRSFRQTGPGAIWLHAVSVGELLSSLEFLGGLRREFPRTRIFVSTSTLAGKAVAEEKIAPLVAGIFYAPADAVWAVRRVLRTLQPSLVLIAETELWPNLLREVKRTGAALALVNGRISDRAFPRYRRFAFFFKAALQAFDAVHAQTPALGDRFVALGAPPGRVAAAGNFKYDFTPSPAAASSPVRRFLERAGAVKVWIAASTMPPAFAGDVDEDDAVISAFRELAERLPGVLLILVPRKPEQFDTAARKLEAAGIRYVRRSQLPVAEAPPLPAVLLLDTIGELSGLFFAADAVFMGGTLAHRGGHNILEPALFSKPVILGPHMENFQAIADEFRLAGACVEIGSAADLAAAVGRLMDLPEIAARTGARALACAEARRGATAAAVRLARDLYGTHLPRYRPAMPWYPLLWLLSRLWAAGARRRERTARERARRLPIPVISVGNLTMGGTGKTPCVLRVAAELKQNGRRPGILTRGYGRRSPEKELVLAPGAPARAEITGDEPQIFLRSGLAPVGIGANRFQAGVRLHREFGIDVAVLDDGFQHRRLARTADVVLLDALNPFGGGNLFPLGRLREPLPALSRADVILITRADMNDLAAVLQTQVRQWNPAAPVFCARLRPESWVENHTGNRHAVSQPPFRRVMGFCGLGNPESFRRTLENLGIPLADWVEFEDHHRYRAREIQHLRSHAISYGADALVTTEKDAINLCENCDELLHPVRLFWLEAHLEIEREREFLTEIERCWKANESFRTPSDSRP